MVFLGAVFIMHWLGWGFSTAILILSIGSFFFRSLGLHILVPATQLRGGDWASAVQNAWSTFVYDWNPTVAYPHAVLWCKCKFICS